MSSALPTPVTGGPATALSGLVEAVARADVERLAEHGIDVEIVLARPGCLVVRGAAHRVGETARACAGVARWLQALPARSGQANGTVFESACATDGRSACAYTLLWAPSGAPADDLSPPAVGVLMPARSTTPRSATTPPRSPAAPPRSIVATDRALPVSVLASALSGPERPEAPARPAARRRPPGRRVGGRWAWVGRRWWMVILGLVVGATAGRVAGAGQPVTYTATATLVVQSGASRAGPGSADDAESLAVTYAALLPSDQAVTRRVGYDLGIPATEVASRVSAQAEAGTALLRVQYSAPSANAAVTGVDTLARTLSDSRPLSTAIPAGSVATVALAHSAKRAGTLYHDGLLLGALLGLVVGLGTALVAERADRRVDDAEALGEVVGCPATTVPGGLSVSELSWALERAVGDRPVSLVPIHREQVVPAEQLQRGLASAWARSGHPPMAVGEPFDQDPEPPGTAAATVLVVGAGERRRAVDEVVRRLRLVGRDPTWTVLVPGRPARPTRPVRGHGG